MRDLISDIFLAVGGVLAGLGGGAMLSQLPPTLPITLLVVGIVILFFPLSLKICYRKPHIIFERHEVVTAGDGERNHFFVSNVSFRNEELAGWASIFTKRGEARKCSVIIDFSIENKPIEQFEYWKFPNSKTLVADSMSQNIPIIYSDSTGKWVSLAGERISTKPSVPPQLLPYNTAIIAVIRVVSDNKPLATSQWLIYVKPEGADPIKMRWLGDNEL